MSAWFVGDAVIDDVVELWRKSLVDERPTDAEATEMGRKLWCMNREALRQRYPGDMEEYDGERGEAIKGYEVRPGHDEYGQLVMSAKCLLYQCSEGDVPETWPLYKWLDLLIVAQPQWARDYDGRWGRSRDDH